MTDELWTAFSILPSEKDAVYRVVDEKQPKEEGEEDVKPVVKEEEDEDEPVRKRRRGDSGRRSEAAPSPRPEEEPSAGQSSPTTWPSSNRSLAIGSVKVLGSEDQEVPVLHESLHHHDLHVRVACDERNEALADSIPEPRDRWVQRTLSLRWRTEDNPDHIVQWCHFILYDDAEDLKVLAWFLDTKLMFYFLPPAPLTPTSVAFQTTVSEARYMAKLFGANAPVDGCSWTATAAPDGSVVRRSSVGVGSTSAHSAAWAQEPFLPTSFELRNIPYNPYLEGDRWNKLVLLDGDSFFVPTGADFEPTMRPILRDLHFPPAARECFLDKLYGAWPESDRNYVHRFRFLTLDECDKIVPISLKPKPDVLSRVYLIFQPLDYLTPDLAVRYYRSPKGVDWAKEIGLDLRKMNDESLFRAFEWGIHKVFEIDEIVEL
ncbi:hypothetical protein JCM6882_002968 [Rhodosporidiobolus microsporus]